MEKEEFIQGLIKSKRKFKMESIRDHMLEALCVYYDHGYVKIFLKRVRPIVEYVGAILNTSPSKYD
jgi:hypothetical protein